MKNPPPTSSSSKAKPILIAIIVLFVGANFYYGLTLLNDKSPTGLPEKPSSQSLVKKVPDFTLTNQDGRDFGYQDLKDKIWVAAFIFTRCPGPCPVITHNMTRIQQHFKDSPDVNLVSFSIDSGYDTPETLTKYASLHKADTSRWNFLTGEQSIVHEISMKGFFSAIMETTPELAKDAGPFIHGTRVYVVNYENTIIGSFDGTTAEGIDLTIAKIESLSQK